MRSNIYAYSYDIFLQVTPNTKREVNIAHSLLITDLLMLSTAAGESQMTADNISMVLYVFCVTASSFFFFYDCTLAAMRE